MIERADVFLQNLGPGVCASRGFSEEVTHALNSSCITCSISGYGNGGPFERRKAYDLLIQAESGLLGVTGSAGEVCKAGVSIADIASGMYASSTILSALIERQSRGKGRHIDVSMLDALVEWMGYPLYYALDGQAPPARTGAAHSTIFPYGPYSTADNKSVLLVIQNDRE